jgi:hypothetical protein
MGTDTIFFNSDSLTVEWQVSNSSAQQNKLLFNSGILAPREELKGSFEADFSTYGLYNINANINTSYDQNPNNDTLKTHHLSNNDTVRIKSSTSFCHGDSALIKLDFNKGTYSWFSDSTFLNSIGSGTSLNLGLLTNDSTVYAKLQTVDGCISTKKIIVSRKNTPYPNLGNDTTVCTSPSFTLRTQKTYHNYVWSDGSIADSLKIGSSGTYYVEVSNQIGLVGSDTIEITVDYPCTGISEKISRDALKIYPNPSSGQVVLKFETALNASSSLVVRNALGKTVKQHTFDTSNSEYLIDLSEQKSGIYFLEIQNDFHETTFRSKLVLRR